MMFRKWVILLLIAALLVSAGMTVAAREHPGQGRPFKDNGGPPGLEGKDVPPGLPEHAQETVAEAIYEAVYRGVGPPGFVREMLLKKFQVIGTQKVRVNGHPLQSDLPPVIKDGRTLIPVRAVTMGLGADKVDWDPEEREVTITRDGVEVVLIIGDNTIRVSIEDDDGEFIEMDVEAQLHSNRTFVPLRFIAQALGDNVDYDHQTGNISINRGIGRGSVRITPVD